MKRQRAKVIERGIYTVIEDTERKENPFYIYYEGNGQRRLVEKHETLTDALLRLVAVINNGLRLGR